MKVRCPICNGTGGVELCFGTGYVMSPTDGCTHNICAKQCPGCGGTGMQEISNSFDPASYGYSETTVIK
jgi:hypothetical protein